MVKIWINNIKIGLGFRFILNPFYFAVVSDYKFVII